MSEEFSTINFQFPLSIHMAHFIIEIFVLLSTLTPLFLVGLIRQLFPQLIGQEYLRLSVLIGFNFIACLVLIIAYKRYHQKIPDFVYRRYILKNINCPKCNSRISSYEKQYYKATDFSEFYYVCDNCKSKNLIEAPDSFDGWRPSWILSSIKPNQKEYERYKNIVESSENIDKYNSEIKNEIEKGKDLKDIERASRLYHIKHGIYKDLDYDTYVRNVTFFCLAIWLIIGALVYKFVFLEYNIQPFRDMNYSMALFSFLFVLTIAIIAVIDYKIKKKKRKSK